MLSKQVRQMANIQASIENVSKIVSQLAEMQREENTHWSPVRPSEPPDFDSTREKGQAFLNGCLFYFDAVRHHFPDEQARINWVLTYFKARRAITYAN